MKFSAQKATQKIEWNARKLVRLQNAFYAKSFHLLRMPFRTRLESLNERLFARAYKKVGCLQAEGFVSKEPLPFERRFEGVQTEIKIGQAWAKEVFDCAWMHVTGILPEANGKELAFLLDVGGEGLVYDKNGNPKQGITDYSSFFCYTLGLPFKKYVCIDGLVDGNTVDFYIDCGANDLFGNFPDKCVPSQLDVVEVYPEIRGLYYDISVLLAAHDVNKKSKHFDDAYKTVRSVLTHAHLLTEEQARVCRNKLRPFLERKSQDDFCFYAMGHAHIDLAWEWPIRETIRKGGRTFSSQIMNLERYPFAYFGAGQAQLYQWIKEYYPTLFEKVKDLHRQGRWELQGATWVESDTNMISGESMLRQFYYGKKFFSEEFGEEVKLLWLPDTFGYSACLPAVMKLSGVDYFLTCRLGYNKAKKFPSVFRWEGLDDSTVLVHYVPDRVYNSPATPYFLNEGKVRFTEKAVCNEAVNLYGIGDGGGGPGFEHLERIMRERDVFGIPKVKPSKVLDYFRTVDNGAAYKRHKGELYLEQFRGTYTTHSKVKYYNRKIEIALQNYEWLAAMQGTEELPISLAETEDIWKEVLLYQFHDVLPGSSINRVYDECEPRYALLWNRLQEGIVALANRLGGVVNLTPFFIKKPVKIGTEWKYLSIPPYGTAEPSATPALTSFSARCGANFIENDCVKVVFKAGKILSLFDKKSGKELICGGKGNEFLSYRDYGNCWTIRPKSYALARKQKARCLSFRTYVDGAKASAEIVYRIGKSTVRQEVVILDGERCLRFDSTIDYREKNNVLRVCFPVAVRSNEASYQLQYGHIARSTHDKTAEEKAMFEVPCQKFFDLSDGQIGISFLNDCKYGCRCKNGKMYLTLFRSPLGGPSHNVDRGEHTFSYGLFIHDGNLSSETYRAAYEFNNPLLITSVSGTQSSFYTTDNENVVLDGVQTLPTGLALRFYNASATEQEANVTFAKHTCVARIDLFGNALAPHNGSLRLPPFGIINLLVQPV